MRMKHWVYMSMALFMGNATQLPVSRAADLGRFPDIRSLEQPRFAPLGQWGLGKFDLKPPKSQSVTVRLFAAYTLHALWLKSPSPFHMGSDVVEGPLYVTIEG